MLRRPSVLLVDDHQPNLELISAYLEPLNVNVVTARDGEEALRAVADPAIDLVLLDVMMPGLDGFEVCRRIKSDPATRLLPVVMVTALSQTPDRVRALEMGADDFIAKPVERIELVARVTSLLRLKRLCDRLDDTEHVILALARAVEARDIYTESHTERVGRAARILGAEAGISGAGLEDLFLGGVIHDIGKIGVPDSILLKPGRLDQGETLLMRRHVDIGAEIVRPLRSAQNLLPIVRHHHERFDGSGYPDGLAGNAIPLAARIVAVCDAYDAMTSDRPYRSGLLPESAVDVLVNGGGKQWDGELVHLFVKRVFPHHLGLAHAV